MLIEGRREVYKVNWWVDLIGYGHPNIKGSRKCFFGMMTRWKTLKTCDNDYHNWDTQLPARTREIFEDEVAKYEEYVDAWEEEQKNNEVI